MKKHKPCPYAPKSAFSFKFWGLYTFVKHTTMSNTPFPHRHLHECVPTERKHSQKLMSFQKMITFFGELQECLRGSAWVWLTPRHFAPSCLWGMWQHHTARTTGNCLRTKTQTLRRVRVHADWRIDEETLSSPAVQARWRRSHETRPGWWKGSEGHRWAWGWALPE